LGETSISNLDSSKRKGIILAGGNGSRLSPISKAVSKQLLPIYDKPMIYYPLSTLMMSGIKEFLIICKKGDIDKFSFLLKDGSDLGISIEYAIQENPDGIAQSFLIGEEFIGSSSCALILGDNLFYGNNLELDLQKANNDNNNSTIFAYSVRDPQRYGIVEFDENFRAKNIHEKPKNPISNFAVTGIYFYDNQVIEIAKSIKPSARGELEISDINNFYLSKKLLKVNVLSRGVAWFDTGTFDSLLQASSFIQTLEKRQGLKIGCLEEIALRMGYIDNEKLESLAKLMENNQYGDYLRNLNNS